MLRYGALGGLIAVMQFEKLFPTPEGVRDSDIARSSELYAGTSLARETISRKPKQEQFLRVGSSETTRWYLAYGKIADNRGSRRGLSRILNYLRSSA